MPTRVLPATDAEIQVSIPTQAGSRAVRSEAPALLVGRTRSRASFDDGTCVVVLAAYTIGDGFELLSLASDVMFHCTCCRRRHEVLLLGVRLCDGCLLCPACYAHLEFGAARPEVPAQRF